MKFEAGKTYKGRFIGDADSVILLTVVKRTAQTITTDKGKRLRIAVWNGVETVKPFGSYSMAPIIGADRPAIDVEPAPVVADVSSQQLAKAADLGAAAVAAGTRPAPFMDAELMSMLVGRQVGETPAGEAPTVALLRAWSDAWVRAHLAAPVPASR